MAKRMHEPEEPTAPETPTPTDGGTAKTDPSPWEDSEWANQPSGSPPTDPADIVVQPPPAGMATFPYLRTNDPDRVDVCLKLDPDPHVFSHVIVPLPNVIPGEKVRYENKEFTHDGEIAGGQWTYLSPRPTHPIELPPADDARKKLPSESHNTKAAANARRVGSGEG